jgi:hypothetical protein
MVNALEELLYDALDHLDAASTLLSTHQYTRTSCPDGVSPTFWEDYTARIRTALTKADGLATEASKTLQAVQTDDDFRALAAAHAAHADGRRDRR